MPGLRRTRVTAVILRAEGAILEHAFLLAAFFAETGRGVYTLIFGKSNIFVCEPSPFGCQEPSKVSTRGKIDQGEDWLFPILATTRDTQLAHKPRRESLKRTKTRNQDGSPTTTEAKKLSADAKNHYDAFSWCSR